MSEPENSLNIGVGNGARTRDIRNHNPSGVGFSFGPQGFTFPEKANRKRKPTPTGDIYGDSSRLVPISRGFFAIVDEEDFERVSSVNWQYVRNTSGIEYAKAQPPGGGRAIFSPHGCKQRASDFPAGGAK